MRTEEQITADIEQAYQELLAEKERRDRDPEIQRPCRLCRWCNPIGEDGFKWFMPEHVEKYGTCSNPLIRGFKPHGELLSTKPMPCGPEKALWEPEPAPPPTLCQRIREWFA